MEKQEKIKRLKENMPLFWNSYKHMYDVRERKAKGMIDFLLIISTFLPMLSATLYATRLFDNPIILIPIIPQILSVIILLKSFVVSGGWILWFEMNKELLDQLESPSDFEVETISVLKKLEVETHISMRENGKLIRNSRALILSSLFIFALSVLFILFEGNLYLYFFYMALSLVSYLVLLYYKKKPDSSSLDRVEKDSRELMKKWLAKR